ncbi:MAG: (2Fe-2S)-binding protein [Paracoccaceae bacterium]
MIVCHCTGISDHDIRSAVDWMRRADPATIITPGKIYHALGHRADCGGCMPLFLDTMRMCASLEVPTTPPAIRAVSRQAIPILRQGRHHEGRSQGY